MAAILQKRDLESQSVIYLSDSETIDDVDDYFEIGSRAISSDGESEWFLNADREWKQVKGSSDDTEPVA